MSELPVGLRRYLEISRQPADSAFHTSQVSISFGEAIDADSLRFGWEAVARAHAALRTSFAEDGALREAGEPAFEWRMLDWQSEPPEDLGAAWQSLVQSDAASPIACGDAAPARITLIRLPNGHGHALWSFHGALIDDAAVSAALHEWLTAYDCRRMGETLPDFSDGPAEAFEPSDDWRETFEGFVPPRPLIVLPLPAADSASGVRRSLAHTFERPERAEFFAAAAAAKADFQSLCGAAWAFVVARATGSDETLLLEPARGGDGIGRRETFVPRRRPVEKFATSGELIRAFAEDRPDAPTDLAAFASALELSAAVAEPATAFLYRDLRLNDRLLLAMPRWMAADTQLFQKTAPAIALRVVATDRPEIALDYDPSRLSDAAAQLLFDAFRGTLTAFAADDALPLAKFALPVPAGLIQSPDAPPTFRSLVPQGLHELFADLAAESPDAVAVEMGTEKLTFAQLNASANQLARHLQKRGVAAGSRVGVAMPRSPRWVAALLGVLKAGATVVPLPAGTSAPAAGIKAWIVDQLTENETRDLPVVQMQAEAGTIGNEKSRGIAGESRPTAEAVAWIEGEKVHAISHEAFAAGLQSTTALLAVTPADRVLQFSPPGTFEAVEEVLFTLLGGATLILREDNRWSTRTAIQEFVQESGVTLTTMPTPFWSQWTQYLGELSIPVPGALRMVALHGDRPTANAVAAWTAAAPATRLLHRTPARSLGGLGLVEESRVASAAADAAAIGRPTPATRARLVDRHGLVLPSGLPGQLEIAPAGAGAFVPLAGEAFGDADGRIYDRAALERALFPSADLTAETIRLAAIAHPDVIDAYVDQRLIAARPEWCVWLLPRDSQRGEPHDFREWLAARLATAPRRVRALPRFPLDDGGNVDVPALAELLPEDVTAPTVRKGTEAEERLRQAISRALGGRRIDFDEIIVDGRAKSQVAKLLYEAASRELPRVDPADFTTGFSVRSLIRSARGRKSEAHSKWMPIQPLRASGQQPPLIFVPDLDGSTRVFAPLVAHLAADRPCYAITPRGLADPEACHASVEEMAAAYGEALRAFDANGPYRLVGYGFGGMVALEMARSLPADKISLLVALATEPPVAASPAGFLAGGWKRALPALFGRKSEAAADIRRRRSTDSPVFRANQEAARKYSATFAPLTVHVFSPERNFPAHRAVQAGWNACCGDARFYQVPCSGPEMMDEPAVEALANAITKLAQSEVLDEELEAGE